MNTSRNLLNEDPIDFIKTQPPFGCLDNREIEQIAETLETEQFAPGIHILSRKGPPSRHLYVIREGAVRFMRDEQVIQILEEGELFGFPSMISHNAPTVDVVAEENVLVYRIPEQVFSTLIENKEFAEFFLKSLTERLRQAPRFETSHLTGDMTSPVEMLINRPPVFIDPSANVGQAAQTMRQAWVSSVLVSGDPPGIITDRDLRSRVLAEALGPDTPVVQVMSRPLKSLPVESPVYGALLFMLQENIHHLPLTRQGEIVGVVTDTDLLRHQAKSPLYILKQLEKMTQPDVLARYALAVAGIAETLFSGGVDISKIGQVIASLNDALIKRLLQLAEEELGPPPTPYRWIVFGSEGRREQALLTDQDNALIYLDDTPQAQTYFSAMAEKVVNGLIQAGFPPCSGGYMATNWNRPLNEWLRLFTEWIEAPKPEALLKAAIFFDFRPVYGELSLEPLEKIIRSAGKQKIFLAQLAKAALEFRPPLGFFRRIRDEDGQVDLKAGGVVPIVCLARLYAFEAGQPVRSTLERLDLAAQAGTLSREGAETLAETYCYLLRLRLREQLAEMKAGATPDNKICLESLSSLERRHLKDAFTAIREIQESTANRFHTDMLG